MLPLDLVPNLHPRGKTLSVLDRRTPSGRVVLEVQAGESDPEKDTASDSSGLSTIFWLTLWWPAPLWPQHSEVHSLWGANSHAHKYKATKGWLAKGKKPNIHEGDTDRPEQRDLLHELPFILKGLTKSSLFDPHDYSWDWFHFTGKKMDVMQPRKLLSPKTVALRLSHMAWLVAF